MFYKYYRTGHPRGCTVYNFLGFVFCMRNLKINLCSYVLATFQRLLLKAYNLSVPMTSVTLTVVYRS